MKKSILHEILAVEPDLEGAAKKLLKEQLHTMKNKTTHFNGSVKYWEMFDEMLESETPAPEHENMVTTVHKNINYLKNIISKYWDVVYQKDLTNQTASADIVIDGKVLAANVPATFLLGLETKLKLLREFYNSLPTLDPKSEWELDKDKGGGVYKSVHPEIRFKTVKIPKSKVAYEATDHHPAQIDRWTEDKNIGKSIKNTWSGMLSSKEKAGMIERLDIMTQAVKQARQRANKTEVITGKIGKKILDYINDEKFSGI